MKNILLTVPFLLLLICCKKVEEVHIAHQPILLETTPISDVTTNAVTLNGKINQRNHEKIIDVGFLLYEISERPTTPKEISVGSKTFEAGSIAYTYTSEIPFQPMASYAYLFYVRTESGFYKGESVHFQIDDFRVETLEKQKATLGSTIHIQGDFTSLEDGFKVFTDQTNLAFTLSEDKHTLYLKLPEQGYIHGNVVEIALQWQSKNRTYPYTRSLGSVEIVATLDPLDKIAYGLSDPIRLTGKGLPTYAYQNFYLLVDGEAVPYSNPFYIRNVDILRGSSFRLGYYNGVDSIYFDDPITLIPPTADLAKFNARQVHPGDVLTVNGLDRYRYFNNKIEGLALGQYPVEIAYQNYEVLYISVGDTPEGVYPLVVQSPYYTYTSTEKIEVKKFYWDKANVNKVYYDDVVTLRGSFIASRSYRVQFNGSSQHIFYYPAKNGELQMKVPLLPPGNYTFKVDYYDDFNSHVVIGTEQDIEVLHPIIEDFSPRYGYPGDLITVKGKGLAQASHLSVDGKWVYAMHLDNGDVQFMVPGFLPAGKVAISAEFSNFKTTADQLLEIK
ncbi:hypothetical protein [Sphingobacterium chuzhouense]|uniref:IPT/TIG domain-containing protein n=1 Tax=Sphingobacterium chuzhouense TaxID=1742264 RepID=A0ABR7XS23_9SPHI|nr:hypothetical protein [Sphingobacterium chuzhouense]MBD1421978.1 hypothetical protein [Sphingobacterium chuzhouense]